MPLPCEKVKIANSMGTIQDVGWQSWAIFHFFFEKKENLAKLAEGYETKTLTRS
jgi:hypothetical protein